MSLTHYEIERKLQQKADLHEVHTLRGDVDRLERALRESRSEINGLRSRCERLEEGCQELINEYQFNNGQFGVEA